MASKCSPLVTAPKFPHVEPINRAVSSKIRKTDNGWMKGEPMMEKIGTETEILDGLETCLELQSSSVRLKGEHTKALVTKTRRREVKHVENYLQSPSPILTNSCISSYPMMQIKVRLTMHHKVLALVSP